MAWFLSKAILICVSGPPGVGELLTAETLAETHRMPLYATRPYDGGYMDVADRFRVPVG